jgi:hypothetical protein
MNPQKVTLFLLIVGLLSLSPSLSAQDLKQEKMEQLRFLVGEWIGHSRIYENGELIKEGAAYEKISYDLDQHILVIELNTEFLQLHTIILYDEEDQSYYYHRFSREGAARYPATFTDGQLVVQKDTQTRFFFGPSPKGGFREYGQQLIDGQWVKTFEDTFINTQ